MRVVSSMLEDEIAIVNAEMVVDKVLKREHMEVSQIGRSER